MNYKIPVDIEQAMQSDKIDSYICHEMQIQIDEIKRKKGKLDLSQIKTSCLIRVKDENVSLDVEMIVKSGKIFGAIISLDKLPGLVNNPDVDYIAADR